ncbi:MAG TPA: AAA family ATPase [Gaiellaceae bacterium]|nr:AAA family ATPase [Gaiellaceae bacterium]
MPPGPRLSIALLGPPVVLVDGAPLRVDTRKALALLAYLAVTGRPARRDTLCALLWRDAAPDRARATLRRTLSSLRSALAGRWLETDGDAVSLDGDGIVLDVAELRRQLAACTGHGHGPAAACRRCATPLRDAVALDRGPFLAGFGLRDAPDFDDWQLQTGALLQRELEGALDRLARLASDDGAHAEALALASRRLALDPLHEPAHRQLIELYARAGDRARALEQYRDCVRTLDRELGVRPLEETTALYHAVLEGEPPGAAAVPEPPPPAGDGAPLPFVGREDACGALAAAAAETGPDGRLVVVEGEPGIGKSRLVEEALARLDADRPLSVRCFQEEAGLPYGLAVQLARGALGRLGRQAQEPWWAGEVARLVPELGPADPAALASVAAQARFHDAVCALLGEAASAAAPYVVAVDDAQWADTASVGLLAYLLRRLQGRPLLVVLAWRPEEVPLDHPLRSVLAAGRTERSARLVSLGGLSRDEVGLLVRAARRDESLTARLHRESGGLPFFVVEYLDALGRGENVEAAEWQLPGGVRDLLRARLTRLGQLAAQVAAAVAVAGIPCDVELARRVSGRAEEETVAALEELVAAGVLVESGDATYDFRHEQARELIASELSLARRRLLHARVAGVLEARADRAGAALVAHHLARAGDDEAAASRFAAAGDHARTMFANSEALAHYRSALAHGHPAQASLHQAIGDLETLAGDYAEALASYERAASESSGAELAEIERAIGRLHHRRGAWEAAETAFRGAAAGLPAGAAVARARLAADRSLTAHRRGRDDDARAFARDALALARDGGDDRALAYAHNALGILASARGDYETALSELEASLARARAAGDPDAEAAALNNLALAARRLGDVDTALGSVRQALALCVQVGDRHREAAVRNTLADLLREAGREEESMAELKLAVSIFAEIGEDARLEPEIWKLVEW